MWFTDYAEISPKLGVVANTGFEAFCGCDDGPTGGDVAGLAAVHHGGPAAGYQGTGTGAGDAGRGVDAAAPVG